MSYPCLVYTFYIIWIAFNFPNFFGFKHYFLKKGELFLDENDKGDSQDIRRFEKRKYGACVLCWSI